MPHTPGPWSADTGDYPVIVNGPDAETQIICIIENPEDPTAATAKTIEENDANARLIAAAPDLLAACQDLVCAANAVLSANAACNTEGANKWGATLAHNLGVLAKERESARDVLAKVED